MKVFNTTFEVSMRLLILLNSLKQPIDEEKILYLDFISVNARNYGFDADNLNGDGLYMLNELTSQRTLIKESIKSLVRQDFISVISTEYGFNYMIKNDGRILCEQMQSDYSKQYKNNSKIVCDEIGEWNIQRIKAFAKEKEEIK